MQSRATPDSDMPTVTDDVAQELPSLPELLASSSSKPVPPSTFAQPEFSAYLSQLTDLPLAELAVEPTTLSSSAAQLTNALTTLCHTSYPTFLSLHATTSILSSSLTSLSSSLDGLLAALPALEDSARSFAQETREIQKERRKAGLVLEQHDKLHDVLSLPMLLDSCVRNHNYNEALLLANHASSLAQRFPANPLIQSVKGECDARVQAMLAQLLSMLREQAKLPALFRAVSFLRKMAVLGEEELALAFLTGRAAYLAGALHAADVERGALEGDRARDRDTHARFLKRHVDVWREGVYDVVTQYTTIFLERAPAPGAPPAPPPARLHMLLRMFTTEQLQALLALLRGTLPHLGDPALLNSALTQLTYCASSFARVGLDFRPLLAPIFVDAVRAAVAQELQDATEAWGARFVPLKDRIGPAATPKRPSQLLVAASASSAPQLPTPAQLEALRTAPPHVPPQLLGAYPPLAVYTNALLTALNGLRLLAPVELRRALLAALDGALAAGAAALLRYAREKPWLVGRPPPGAAQAEEDAAVLRAVGAVYFEVFVPFVVRALAEGVYGRPVGDAVGKQVAEVRKEWNEVFPAEAEES